MITNRKHYLAPDWPAPQNVKACTTLRFDGASKPPFEGFNLSMREPEDSQDTLANRTRLRQELDLKNEPVWISQVHGTNAIQADKCNTSMAEADASYTKIPETVCAVLTADCLPVLVCNKAGTEVAAIHAGWKGLQAGAIESTIHQLETTPADCLVWLGPGIGPNAFEVGSEVRDLFLEADPTAEIAFTPHAENKWLCDMYTIAKQRLTAIGVKGIYGGEYCTYSDPENFYSYRRDKVTGRMGSLIWMTES